MKFLRGIADILWPRGFQCLCCEETSEGALLCPTCLRALNAMRLHDPAASENVYSSFRYDGAAKQLVLRLKEDCTEDAAHALAEDMADTVKLMNLPKDAVLTWVTMPEARRKARGIDHGRCLCEAVAARVNMPVCKLLQRRGNLHTQRGLSREARLQNLAGTFVCHETLTGPVLLIDDVMTTGATASVCAETLMAAGATQVFVLTATRAALKAKNDESQERLI